MNKKIKRYLTVSVVMILVASIFAATVSSAGSTDWNEAGESSLEDESTTADDPIEIYNWHDLNETRNHLSANYILMNDLDENTSDYKDFASENTNELKDRGGWKENTTYEVNDLVEYKESNYYCIESHQSSGDFKYDHWVETQKEEGEALGWEPIGDEDVEFNGTFDGNGYEIRDLYIDRPDEYYVGLFGAIGDGGEITGLGVVDANVTGISRVGGLVGDNRDGTVSDSYLTGDVSGEAADWTYYYIGGLVGDNGGVVKNSHFTGNVSGYKRVGGLVGYNRDTVSNSYATGNVSGDDMYVGGLVGDNSGMVNNSYATGYVDGEDLVGGLVGDNDGTVNNSYATGNVSGGRVGGFTESGRAGGLVGGNDGTLNNSNATGNVSGYYRVGGLVGENTGTVSESYATGAVSGEKYEYVKDGVGGLVGVNINGTVIDSYATGRVSGDEQVGGLVGFHWGTVNNSYAIGNVSGNDYVGGLVGQNDDKGKVNNSYAIGNVSVSGYVVGGGLVGDSYKGTVENSFWDIAATGQDTSEGGTGKYTGRMVKKETFTDAGWDFEDTWDIIEEETYPFLQWQVEDNYPYSPELEKYELTINIEGEGMVKVDGTEVEEGWTQEYIGVTEVALEGIPDEGWEFNEWTGTDETGDETTIKMNKDKEITAHFEIKTYNLTVETTGEGLIDIEPEKVEYEHGEVVNLTAVPDESWAFVNWTGNKTGSNETITVMMNEDKEITARFKEKDDDGGGTPGFTTMSLLVASIIALAIYHKKKR